MSQSLPERILQHVKSGRYQPQQPRRLAKDLEIGGEQYAGFRDALKQLMRDGRVMAGAGGSIVLPPAHSQKETLSGTYRQNRKGFGFVIPTDPDSHEDLYIAEGENGGAISGDIVSAKIISRSHRDGKQQLSGRVMEVLERTHKRFVGTLQKQGTRWVVMPDGNVLTSVIEVADAGSRHIRAGSKVIVELTIYPQPNQVAQGVITEVLGKEGEKDVDLKSVIAQHNLPEKFPEEALEQARQAIEGVDWDHERATRLDLSSTTVVTIDPDDAKDYDDAISLEQVEGGHWELGVHIADVARFVPEGSPLDAEAQLRGNSVYFPGFVIPMIPEVLSNGVCSLQEGVGRLCKSAFITLDDDARPLRTRFANTLITSSKRLRYREAQALIDGQKLIPHPDGDRKRKDYSPQVLQILKDMDLLARRIQKRRLADGQIVLELPVIQLVLDDQGKVIDAVPEDTSFTHTIIEMFMVEANEAVARLLDQNHVPFLRRIHPGPGERENIRLREFVEVAGHKLPKVIDHKSIQALLDSVRGTPESYAINLSVLKSLTRAEYSPEDTRHFALGSEDYCHYTSPIRRYADLTIHRLLQYYLTATQEKRGRKSKVDFGSSPDFKQLVDLGKRISFTERRAEDAERELRRVKVLTLLQGKIGEVFNGVVTGITNFGIFVQLREWLIEGLIRYEHLLDDWWDVNEKAGEVRGQRTGTVIRIGNVMKVLIAKVDIPRRELDLGVVEPPEQKPKHGPQQQQGQRQRQGQGQEAHRKGPPKRGASKQPPRGGGPRKARGRR